MFIIVLNNHSVREQKGNLGGNEQSRGAHTTLPEGLTLLRNANV